MKISHIIFIQIILSVHRIHLFLFCRSRIFNWLTMRAKWRKKRMRRLKRKRRRKLISTSFFFLSIFVKFRYAWKIEIKEKLQLIHPNGNKLLINSMADSISYKLCFSFLTKFLFHGWCCFLKIKIRKEIRSKQKRT